GHETRQHRVRSRDGSGRDNRFQTKSVLITASVGRTYGRKLGSSVAHRTSAAAADGLESAPRSGRLHTPALSDPQPRFTTAALPDRNEPYMISASRLTLRRGPRALLEDASFSIHGGWRVGVIGR